MWYMVSTSPSSPRRWIEMEGEKKRTKTKKKKKKGGFWQVTVQEAGSRGGFLTQADGPISSPGLSALVSSVPMPKGKLKPLRRYAPEREHWSAASLPSRRWSVLAVRLELRFWRRGRVLIDMSAGYASWQVRTNHQLSMCSGHAILVTPCPHHPLGGFWDQYISQM